jgi:hypothetical protein
VQELFCKSFAKGSFSIYFSFEIGLFKNVHYLSQKYKIALFPQSIMFKDNDHQKHFLKKTL